MTLQQLKYVVTVAENGTITNLSLIHIWKMDAASGNLDLQQVAEIHSEFPHQYQSFLCAGHEEPCPDGDTDSAAPVRIRACLLYTSDRGAVFRG